MQPGAHMTSPKRSKKLKGLAIDASTADNRFSVLFIVATWKPCKLGARSKGLIRQNQVLCTFLLMI